MEIRCLPLIISWALMACGAVQAQPSSTPPAASAPAPTVKPGPRLLTPQEKRDNAAPADNARPEGTVTPQINIPLGAKASAPLKLEGQPDSSPRRSASAAIDDSAARCSAVADASERASCVERHSRDPARK